MRAGVILIGLVALLAPAHASAGRLVFVRAGVLWEADSDGLGAPVQLAPLPPDVGPITAIDHQGGLYVLHTPRGSLWLKAGQSALGSCGEAAHPSPRGSCVVCEGKYFSADGTVSRDAELPAAAREVDFRGPGGFELAGLTDDGVIGFDWRTPAAVRKLAAARPRSHLVIAPDGERAVGIFGEGATSRIRAFLLDGKGVTRQLGGPGIPLVWSADSTWVLTQEGIDPDEATDDDENGGEGARDASAVDPWLAAAPKRKKARPKPRPEPPPPRTRVCAVRSTGGEAKCWDDYDGLSFSPDSKYVLMRREQTLYVGTIAGVRPVPPVKRLDDVDGAALWLP
jgi:hypothetical protein